MAVLEIKQCSCCKEWLNVSLFYKDKTTEDGYTKRCKSCHVSGDRRRNRCKHDNDPAGTKVCCHCGRALPLTMFSRNRARRDGYKSECKDCSKMWQSSFYRNINRRPPKGVYMGTDGRLRVDTGGRGSHPLYWSEEALKLLRTYSEGASAASIADTLGCTRECVLKKIKQLGIKKVKNSMQTPQVLSYIRENYATTPNKEMAKVLGVHPKYLAFLANKLGCHKDVEYQRQVWLNNAKHVRECNKARRQKKLNDYDEENQ